MKRIVTIMALVFAAGLAGPAHGASRTLEEELPVEGARTVVLDAAVGDVTVRGVEGDTIRVTVELRPRKGRFFGSRREGDEQVARTELEVKRSGAKLRLSLDWPSGDPLFEADWSIELPPSLAVNVDLGVGDVLVEGLAGDLDVDSGVGDVTVAAADGDVAVDLGVGEVKVTGPLQEYGKVKCSTGVGDCTLKAGSRKLSGTGMISKDLAWRGDGPSSIHVDTGVGSVTIVLEE